MLEVRPHLLLEDSALIRPLVLDGVPIGKARYTIQCLPDNSLAKIQVVSDADKVELFGTLESIKWAERLIKDVNAKADAGGSPSLVAQGFSSDQAASAGEQREFSVEKADAGGSPSLVAQGFSTDQAASAGEQHEDCVEKISSVLSPQSEDDPSDVCRVDKCTYLFLGIDEGGGYYVSDDPQKIPPKYCIEQVEKELFGLRKYQVKKHGEDTYDIVMVGCLNIINYITWIAGGTFMFEEPDYTKEDPVELPPLAFSFPANMAVEEYKSEHMDAYTEMVSDILKCAMEKAQYDPAKYGFDKDLCLAVIGESVPRKISLKPDDYPCEFCGGVCECPSESEYGSSETDSEDL